jgi:hypothetical protein
MVAAAAGAGMAADSGDMVEWRRFTVIGEWAWHPIFLRET